MCDKLIINIAVGESGDRHVRRMYLLDGCRVRGLCGHSLPNKCFPSMVNTAAPAWTWEQAPSMDAEVRNRHHRKDLAIIGLSAAHRAH